MTLMSSLLIVPARMGERLPRRFLLVRTADVTGISGAGIVAEGVAFTDGTAVLRWTQTEVAQHKDRGVRPTTVIHDSTQSVEALHGHNGATRIQWLDWPETQHGRWDGPDEDNGEG